MLHKIRGKMIAQIALPTLVIYVVVLGLTMSHLRDAATTQVEGEMTRLADSYAARFDGAFREVAAIAATTARFLETQPDLSEEKIYKQLRANILQNPVVYGAAVAFEPGSYKQGDELFCPYVYRSADGLEQMNISRDTLDWYGDQRWQWWHKPKQTGEGVWTDPYFDEGAGNVLMVTYSAPFFRDGALRGVTTVDIMLPTLQESIGRDIVEDLDFVILTSRGQYVYSRFESEIMSRTVFDVAVEVGRPDIAAAATRIVSGETGVVVLDGGEDVPDARRWDRWNEPQWVFFSPIESTGWAFAALVAEREALAGVQERMTIATTALAGTLALIIGCIFYVSGRITRPIARLRAKVLEVAGGNLDAGAIEVTSRDEVGDLAGSFNKLTEELKTHIERLASEQAASRDAVIFAMAKLAESRDDDTGKHLDRICKYVEVLATEMAGARPGVDGGWVEIVTITAALHDIGKVGIPDAVLCKPGKLNAEERKVIQTHTTIGGDTLLALKQRWNEDTFLVTATEIAFAHHERWDGSGYPFGLAREDIALAARIVAVADVYDALTSERVYKKAMTHDEARKIIVEGSGSHFDPDVVDAFLATEKKIQAIAAQLKN